MGIAKNLLLWFASGLFVAAGQKMGEFLASQITNPKPQGGTAFSGAPARELCPQCGNNLKRFSKTLYCNQCGYREG